MPVLRLASSPHAALPAKLHPARVFIFLLTARSRRSCGRKAQPLATSPSALPRHCAPQASSSSRQCHVAFARKPGVPLGQFFCCFCFWPLLLAAAAGPRGAVPGSGLVQREQFGSHGVVAWWHFIWPPGTRRLLKSQPWQRSGPLLRPTSQGSAASARAGASCTIFSRAAPAAARVVAWGKKRTGSRAEGPEAGHFKRSCLG